MEQITAFKASDGAIFAAIEECQEHEFSLMWRDRINEFMASGMNQYQGSAQAGIVRKTVLAWEQYKTGA